MINSSATQSSGPDGPIIPARRDGVTGLRVHAFLAIMAALGLRLLFVFRFPGSAGDSDLYIQFARTWADHHVYGFLLDGLPVPTDLRMPGYPAFLAEVAQLLGRSIRAILLSQALLDIVTCFLTAALSAALAPASSRRRIWIIGLWLAATCPFVANYTAVVLTEVLVTLLATAALYFFVVGLSQAHITLKLRDAGKHLTPFAFALLGGVFTGLATLVRPEMPLLMGVGVLVYVLRAGGILGARKTILFAAAMAGAFLLPLLPWAARNLITLRKIQFLAPRYATMPDEYAPVGYYAWTATWLERYRDVYVSAWRIGEEPLNIDDLPNTAFDSPNEKARVSELFAEYNDSPNLEISPELDRQFVEIARERTRRHPLRTYVRVPFERALTIWFTPRTELMSIDGKFWPLREQWTDSYADVIVTGSFALLGYVYIALAIAGIWSIWRTARGSTANGPPVGPNLWGIALLVGYFVVRTAFLTTVETPEPRYVVSCYPGALALISLLGVRRNQSR
jgi:hypothetical protein